jgi:NAD+ diphosphatase
MPFVSGYQPWAAPTPRALCFGFHASKILVKLQEGQPRIPQIDDLTALSPRPEWRHYFGDWNGSGCWAICFPPNVAAPQGFAWKGLRELFGQVDEEVIWVAGRAAQLVHWHRNHGFCGRCGAPTEDHPGERAKRCPVCGLMNHPRVSPAIIVAVVRDRQLLLAHATRFPAKFYSVLAGFVEPGETLEECVRREVFEETGLQVRNIRYFGSQPWPFPDSLMVAFTAEYEAGEIHVNPAEIMDAGWFRADRLPEVPPPISIARRLINWFSEEFGNGKSTGTP